MDVLDSRTPRRARRTTRLVPTALAWAGVGLALVLVVPDARQGGLDLLEPAQGDGGPGAVVLLLDPDPAVVGRTSGLHWDGVLVLELEGGAALLQASAAAQAAAVGPTVRHSWGGLQATLGDRRCSGTFGWRATSGDPYGGGLVDLACDDGTARTGRLRTSRQAPVEDTTWGGILDLARGPQAVLSR
jgi:hypothetical protein